MGLMQKIFGPRGQRADLERLSRSFRTFTEYTPAFSSWAGGVYELELTRSAIHSFATACSKLKPEIQGSAKPSIHSAFKTSPNAYMTWPKFLYRLATILECDTTAYIVPQFAPDGETITGFWPLKCESAEIVQKGGEPWVLFHMAEGDDMALELAYVGIVTKYQYESDFFGTANALSDSMEMMSLQTQAQRRAVEDGAALRFIGAVNGMMREDDIEAKRKRFREKNLSAQNASGILIYDNTFQSVEQVKPYSYTVPADEMDRINQSVMTYFGTNQEILQNKYTEDKWNAYYEGKVEPFAIQVGEAMTQLSFTVRERKAGNAIMFSSNRLEYATSASKRNMIRDMLDRGVFCIDDAREILQMPPLPNDEGKVRVIRGEYIDASMMNSQKHDKDPIEHDLTKKDTDLRASEDVDSLDD